MIAASIVSAAAMVSLAILSLAFLLTVFRVVVGPTLPDRVLALDMLAALAIGFIAVIAIKTGFTLYIDIAIALGLVGFLATVAFARFILTHGTSGQAERQPSAATAAERKRVRRDGRRKKRGR
ncbi:cation:proton antiporter [Rhizobium leucaenae]|uniref:Multicomponent Na+:H+ antiporter subunit F n=1 Tax=Rhizobium leucaenae TaxID=29450 RepID=A0A7W7EKA9_9HYPH|nr:cation:proton antiporter [Rhizobium leucaenae]MBB4568304.1 multicomponent Na+:H+ antiporter subunit F [Rhizobium leucaenae]MBB6300537.1 multicomponent Na+:H+ antiporter subunit F [Rhizobium leucaenae]